MDEDRQTFSIMGCVCVCVCVCVFTCVHVFVLEGGLSGLTLSPVSGFFTVAMPKLKRPVSSCEK